MTIDASVEEALKKLVADINQIPKTLINSIERSASDDVDRADIYAGILFVIAYDLGYVKPNELTLECEKVVRVIEELRGDVKAQQPHA